MHTVPWPLHLLSKSSIIWRGSLLRQEDGLSIPYWPKPLDFDLYPLQMRIQMFLYTVVAAAKWDEMCKVFGIQRVQPNINFILPFSPSQDGNSVCNAFFWYFLGELVEPSGILVLVLKNIQVLGYWLFIWSYAFLYLLFCVLEASISVVSWPVPLNTFIGQAITPHKG